MAVRVLVRRLECFVFVTCALLIVAAYADNKPKLTVYEKIREDPDLSEFCALLESNPIANTTLQWRHVTLFAPTNAAFQKYKGPTNVLYHMINLAQTTDSFGQSLSTEMEGNPPLWVTVRKGKHTDDIFVNNAMIIKSRSNYVAENAREKRQVLHVIDEVLVPVLVSQSSSSLSLYNINAFTFLNQTENLDMGSHRVRSFRQRVSQTNKDDIYSSDGRFTFFIPVDEGFKPPPRPEKIDGKVIDGHVIPNKVLFTNPTTNDVPFETLAFGDNLKVQVLFSTTTEGRLTQTYVKSNTLIGDSSLATGVVLAQIVKANIPVRNGVIHLINRPLMIVDTNVTAFLQDKEESPLFNFYEILMDVGAEFINKINQMRDLTLFAPNNTAWNDPSVKNIIQDKDRIREILNLHLVSRRLPLERIMRDNYNSVPTAAAGKSLYFNVINSGNDQILTVEGGGVNATVVQPNIAATNGIVHIIDRVLGVPYTTVFEKLKTDPMLNDTFTLGNAERFNEQLNDKTKMYTYFVPRDKAWQKTEIEYPSTHKKLFMKDFSYHTRQILERHLVISDVPYTMDQIKAMANETNFEIVLPTVRDTLKIRVKETDKSYYIEWQNEWIHVFRPDVECTNGVIHVIDKPLLKDSDIRVTGAAIQLRASTVVPQLIMILIAKWLML